MAKQEILDLFHGKELDYVPSSFWYHYCSTDDFPKGLGNREMFKNTVDKHIEHLNYLNLDLLKIMPDGYFTLPSLLGKDTRDIEVLKNLQPSDPKDSWFEEQIELVRQIKAKAQDAAVFYTIFSPLSLIAYSQFQFGREKLADETIAKFIEENPEAVAHALEVVTKDVETFATRVLTEGGADGAFFAVRNYRSINKETYEKFIKPGEVAVTDAIAAKKDLTILHVCGGFGSQNDFSIYRDYNFRALNYAVGVEKLSLGEAKASFPDKVIIGGFDNTPKSILIHGSKEELEAEALRLIKEAGTDRLVIGADCSLPTFDVVLEKLKWVVDYVTSVKKEDIHVSIRKN